jgi:cell division protein ZipA
VRTRFHSGSDPLTHEVYKPTTPVLDTNELDQLEEMIPERGASEIKTDEMPMIIELGSEQIAPAGEQLFIPLTLITKVDQQLSGDTIQQATATAGLLLKDDGIYRFEVKDAQGYRQPLLGLANILEPGTFELAQMDQFATPGLVLYLHLPAPIEAREAFDHLIAVGHKLEELLEAELCDETRSVLTKQTIGHLKEKVEAFRFKQKMTQLQRRRP